MVDYENEIYTKLATSLRSSFTGIDVEASLTLQPSAFPCACIEEADNFVVRSLLDSGDHEKFVETMYEVNVLSNAKSGSKAQCRQILEHIDEKFWEMGFIRISKITIPEELPITYRMVARYSAVISADGKIYRR